MLLLVLLDRAKTWVTYFLLCLTITTACVEPYPPAISDGNVDYLVIDAFLDSADGSVRVQITRAIPVESLTNVPVENAANVVLESEAGVKTNVPGKGEGNYSVSGLPIDGSTRYRLRIRLQSGQEYLSDFIGLKPTPPIDSLTWGITEEGVRIFLDTHDAMNQARYYKWDLIETWEYNPAFKSNYKFVGSNNNIVQRAENESVNTCWISVPSKKILTGSSKRLSQDVISRFPLELIEKGSPRLFIGYSLLVKQYALSKEAFDYWQVVKQATEELGSLYDTQPGPVRGNFHNTNNNSEAVIGFFDGGQVQEKRFFLGFSQLPEDYKFKQTVGQCQIDTAYLYYVPRLNPIGVAIIEPIYFGITLAGYQFSAIQCGDCRATGGTTLKPSFWPK